MSKLVVMDERDGFMLAWADDDGEAGAYVGQDAMTLPEKMEAQLAKAKAERRLDDIEYWTVEIAARNPNLPATARRLGYVCDSRSAVNRFAAHLRAAVKAARAEFKTGRPPEDWETKARAAGWKPPKGWKS